MTRRLVAAKQTRRAQDQRTRTDTGNPTGELSLRIQEVQHDEVAHLGDSTLAAPRDEQQVNRSGHLVEGRCGQDLEADVRHDRVHRLGYQVNLGALHITKRLLRTDQIKRRHARINQHGDLFRFVWH